MHKNIKPKIMFIFLLYIFFTQDAIKIFAKEIPPDIKSEAAVLIDADTGIVIYNKNMNDRYYPASITKLMTVLLAMEYADGDYEQRIPFSSYSVFSLPYGSSHIAMDEGETLSLEESLYGIMLASANEVSNAVAEKIAGDVDIFASMMTKRAKELGALDTNFVNPHGLHDPKHYTTPYDIALVMKELLKYPDFLAINQTQQYNIEPTEKQSQVRPLNNSHKMIVSGKYYDERVAGGKTGFTNEAGHTLVTYAVSGEKKLICVIMKAPEKYADYTETKELLDYGFASFDTIQVFDKEDYSQQIKVVQEHGEDIVELAEIQVKALESLNPYLPATIDSSEIVLQTDLPEKIYAPVRQGQKIGLLTFLYNDIQLGEISLSAGETVNLISAEILDKEKKAEEAGMLAVPQQLLPMLLWVISALGLFMLFAYSVRIYNIRKRRVRRRMRSTYRGQNSHLRYRYRKH